MNDQYRPETKKRINDLDPMLLNALRNRGLCDAEIVALNPRELFTEFCAWHGIHGCDFLYDIADSIRALETSPVPMTPEILAELTHIDTRENQPFS